MNHDYSNDELDVRSKSEVIGVYYAYRLNEKTDTLESLGDNEDEELFFLKEHLRDKPRIPNIVYVIHDVDGEEVFRTEGKEDAIRDLFVAQYCSLGLKVK